MARDQTLIKQLVFSAKVFALQTKRRLDDLKAPPKRWRRPDDLISGERKELRSPLYADPRAEERLFELGKVANLRAAIRYLNGIQIPAGEMFSFWRSMGRATRRRGFVNGRMLQLGCVVPAVGGGLCQLSNLLYELALQTDCEILERHAHSKRLAGTRVRDATVAWNYIDLRFRPKRTTRIELRLSDSELIVTFIFEGGSTKFPSSAFPVIEAPQGLAPTCATCSEVGCTRHEQVPSTPILASAFLVDSFTPEFDKFVQRKRTDSDWLFVPIAGQRWHLGRYAWTESGFDQVKAQPIRTLCRAVGSRRLASQGAVRQTYLLRSSADLAAAMLGDLPYWINHLVIDQTLLVYLWQSGALGGRTFDVLMRRLPISDLEAVLDRVASRWPESGTANDFRAPSSILLAEREALQAARQLITAHHDVAQLFPGRAVLLEWCLPREAKFSTQADDAKPRILYPGPVAARKGAYLLREAIEGLPVELVIGGAHLEGPDFWPIAETRQPFRHGDSFSMVVQPSFVEEQPRALLQALKCGIPAIGTTACGLAPQSGLELVNAGDVVALRQAILRLIR